MSISKEILEWSVTRPAWQRDALRRFVTRQAFVAADENEILVMLKFEHRLIGEKVPIAKPLEEKHLPEEAALGGPVQLASVGDICNANRLAAGQILQFAIDGLTVIYGDNGSGKSGYVRILKQACRTREAGAVLPDVFKAAGGERPKATVRYRVSPEDSIRSEEWESGQEFAAVFSQISVFDSGVATIAVDKENELAFVPFGLDALDKLAELCAALKERLSSERKAIANRIGDKRQIFGDDADVVAALNKITEKTSDAALETMSRWTVANAERLTLVSLMLSDPDAQAKGLRARKSRCDLMLKKLTEVSNALGAAGEARLRQCVSDVDITKQALKALSVAAFSAEPLPGIGSEAWRLMYDSARTFSIDHAYPDRIFPATEIGDRCVLCHQSLDEEARRRLERFEMFVRADVDTKAQAAIKALGNELSSIDVALETLGSLAESLTGADPADSQWATNLSVLGEELAKRGRVFKLAVTESDWSRIPPAPTFDVAEVGRWPQILEAQAVAHDAALAPEKKAELATELARLNIRKVFSVNNVALAELRDLIATDEAYDKCLKAVATHAISQKRKEMDESYVQGALRNRLDEELKALRLESIPVNLGFKVAKAKAKHQIQLDGSAAATKVKEVVSEGEYRALALACFLAQVRQQSAAAGIIVDDPVSSLDHDRRELVAQRLATEAKIRQVIVFTHDLVFFFMLREAAAELQVPFEGRSLYRGAGGFGTVDPHEPWKAKTLSQRLQTLETTELKLLEELHLKGGAEYEVYARAFCDRLRESWERLVEEGIFFETVRRFNPGVKTLRLEEVEVSDEIADKVYWGMTKISNWTGHDPASSKNLNLPSPDELKLHIGGIRECEEQVRKQRKITKARREALREAPKATII